MQLTLDRPYYARFLKIAIPIAIQNGINALLSTLDVLMIGQLGATAVAAAALANQVAFLLTFFLYGITSGAAAFSAQYWGTEDIIRIRKILGICLMLCFGVAILFTIAAELFPATALGLYTQDQAVIQQGVAYLQIAGLSYLFSSISLSYSAVLKGMGQVRLPMAVSVTALSLKAFLSYALIFGNFGLPALGLVGGAVGTLAARMVEFGLMLGAVYFTRSPLASRIGELFRVNRAFVVSYLKVALPVVINEILWASGFSLYSAIYARISTDALTAVNIATSLDGLAFVLIIACGDAGGILTGNEIGAGRRDVAGRFARRSLIHATLLGVLIGGVILALSGVYPTLYQVTPEIRAQASSIMIVMGLLFWLRGSNFTLIIGVLRAGGDTRFSALIDTGAVWLVGIPMALAGVYLFHLPVWGVYLLIMADEITRYVVTFRRFRSGKWIHQLANAETSAG